ncbi:hypothetical protein [Haliovirga abyssi]|uniref:SLH domain-containing protein n=1 Tax=Haliovirga abyssi TaxID=2996794 RepID=A0AAU9D0F0_9FUSO|nr:hypothetical protein [Haliovirga abyssi]BDU49444.1 hypothetical protein HLVA_00130 [Haliovirga abyssi]
MKKIKLALAFFTILSSLAFASFNDVPDNHWASNAVRNLYNKGLLAPSLDNATKFKGEGVFSRYEIASMLYSNLSYVNEKLEKKASAQDLEAIKVLVTNFAPELVKLGAKSEELDKKIAKMEKEIGDKLGKKIDKLKDDVNKVKISGDFSAEQIVGMKDNNPGMRDLDYTGNLTLSGKVNKNVSAKVKLGIDQGKDASVDAIELKAKSKKLTVAVFKDSDKEVASFEDTFNLFAGDVVDPDNGVIANGNLSLLGNSNKYVAMMYKTGSGDFYGMQVKQNFDVLKKMGINAFVRGSYAEKVINYKWDDAKDSDNARGLYAVDGELVMKPLPIWSLTVSGEYGTRRSPGIENVESDAINAYVPSRDAIYLYTKNLFKLGWLGKIDVRAGLYNSGEYFDVAGMGKNTKTVFAETDIVKLEADKKAYLAYASYDLFSKGWLTTNVMYSSYGANIKDSFPKEKINSLTTLNLWPGKIKLELEGTLEKDEKLPADAKAGKLEAAKGKITIEQRNKFTLIPKWTENVNFHYEMDRDKDEKVKDDARIAEVYVDHGMDITKNSYFKVAGKINIKGLGLGKEEDAEKKTYDEDGKWVIDHSYDKKVTVETGSDYEIRNVKLAGFNNKFIVGGRFSIEDKQGKRVNAKDKDGNDIKVKNGDKDVNVTTTKNTEKLDDNYKYRAFVYHKLEKGNFTLYCGAKYEKELTYQADSKNFKDTDDSDDVKYAVGMEYNFGNDTTATLKYGDPTVTEDSGDFISDKTSFADGEQDQLAFNISAKF